MSVIRSRWNPDLGQALELIETPEAFTVKLTINGEVLILKPFSRAPESAMFGCFSLASDFYDNLADGLFTAQQMK